MKKIIIILFFALLVLAGLWYFESQKITQNSFQPTDNNYVFVENEVQGVPQEQESDKQQVQISAQTDEKKEPEIIKSNVLEGDISNQNSNVEEEISSNEVNSKISIYSPTQDQTFRPGETIKIKFSAPDNLKTLLLLANVKGGEYDEDTLLYLKEDGDVREFEYTIPEEAYTGVGIVITGLGGEIPIQDTLDLDIIPNSRVESISLLNDSLRIGKDFVSEVVLEGVRTDGQKQLIYEDSDITYTVSDPTIARWYDTNRFIGLKEGETEIIITYKDLSITAPVYVFVSNIDFGEIPQRS